MFQNLMIDRNAFKLRRKEREMEQEDRTTEEKNDKSGRERGRGSLLS